MRMILPMANNKATDLVYIYDKNTGYLRCIIGNARCTLNCHLKDTPCNATCSQYEKLADGSIKMWCTGRIIKPNKIE